MYKREVRCDGVRLLILLRLPNRGISPFTGPRRPPPVPFFPVPLLKLYDYLGPTSGRSLSDKTGKGAHGFGHSNTGPLSPGPRSWISGSTSYVTDVLRHAHLGHRVHVGREGDDSLALVVREIDVPVSQERILTLTVLGEGS